MPIARPRDVRNLHRAVPLKSVYEGNSYWLQLKKEVDVAYKRFWRKRGKRPPKVSKDTIGCLAQ